MLTILLNIRSEPMDFLKTAFDMASNAAQNYYSNYTKEERLKESLKTCTYPDDVKFVIEKAVKQVYNVYPKFDAETLQFYEKGQLKRYLQLKSKLEIEIRGGMNLLDFNIMIPIGFPRRPPFVRIINPDPTNAVHPVYQSLRSTTDPSSYLLNQLLMQVRSWDETKSIVNIIIESQNILRQNYPFVKANPNFYAGQSNTYGGNGGNGSFGFQAPRPPIPFVTSNINQIIAAGQKYSGESKKTIQKLKYEHVKCVNNIQMLEAIKSSLESQEQYLRHQNLKITRFLQKSEDSCTQDLTTLIAPKDNLSEQILDLAASLRAKEDCMVILEQKFGEGLLDFSEFMKLARKLEEEQFDEKYLLKKCIQMSR